jgi:hypothetical protein
MSEFLRAHTYTEFLRVHAEFLHAHTHVLSSCACALSSHYS